jgi:hypothetical protein
MFSETILTRRAMDNNLPIPEDLIPEQAHLSIPFVLDDDPETRHTHNMASLEISSNSMIGVIRFL